MKPSIIKVYGDMHKKIKSHSKTYLECEIPKALEDELEGMIDKRIREFEKSCKCDFCKQKRIQKK